MAKASSGALSTVILDPSDEQYVKSFREAQASLQEALDSRNNQLFDPMLLAISQALGAPTKTGSFGEVLGNVAGAIGTSQQAEEKRAQDIAKMRFDMAQQNFMMNRKDQAAKMFAPPQAGAPAAGAPAGAPASGASAAPAAGGAETPAVPKPAGLSQYSHITPELALQIGLRDPELGKQAMQYIEAVNAQRKLAQEGVRVTDKGSFVVDPTKPGGGTFTPAAGTAYVERFVPGVGNVALTQSDAIKLDEAKDVLSRTPDNVDAQKELSRLISKSRGPQKDAATGPMTPAEAELEKKRKETLLASDLKSDAERKQDFVNKSISASARLPSLSSLEQFAQSADASKLLGVFEGSSLGQAIAKMVDPTLPQLREAFTQYGLPEGVKADQSFALQQVALINSEIRKITRAPGEGAQSDLENRMALAAGLDKTDTPGGFLKKVRFLKAQAEFQRDLGREMNKSKLAPTDFLLSNRYDDLLQTYEQKLNRVLGMSPQKATSQQARSSQGSGATYEAQRQKLNQTLGIKP